MSKNFQSLIIAVDGYSSTGKSTVSKIVAARLGLIYIDTGAMYRAVTLEAMRRGMIVDGRVDCEQLRKCLEEIRITFRYNPESNRNETCLNDERVEEAIRGMEVSDQVSLIATLDFVREFLVGQQREMGRNGGVVMDGRDIGSVVFPDADVKFFMTALSEIRAKRRYDEMIRKGDQVDYAEVEANVRKRDYIDEHREVSPLKRTIDAIMIDNSNMTIEEEVELVIGMIEIKS